MRKDVTLREATEASIRDYEDTRDKPRSRTLDSYWGAYNKAFGIGAWARYHHLPHELKVTDLKTAHIQELKAARIKQGLKKRTINQEIRLLRKGYNYALHNGAQQPEIAVKIEEYRVKDKTRFVTMLEEKQILHSADHLIVTHKAKYGSARSWEVAKSMYVFFVDSGVRLSELLGIRLKDVDLDEGHVNIYRIKTEESGMAEGIVYLTPRMRIEVERLIKDDNLKSSDRLFKGPERALKYLRMLIHEVCNKDAETIERKGTATVHSLRDTFGSRLANNDVSLLTISVLLGHTTPAMTRKYTHIEAARKSRDARDILAAMVSSGPSNRNI